MENDIGYILKRNGQQYTVRKNRDRFFFPDEWMSFYDLLRDRQKTSFDILIQTGARINEARHIKVGDVDFERNNLILRVTKVKASKGEKNPKPRTITISSQFARRLRAVAKERELSNDNTFHLPRTPSANDTLKLYLQKSGIKDWKMFSIHNIRKTHGNWLKAMGIDGTEICLRLGHDYQTFLKSYASPDIFSFKDLQNMKIILGDLYANRGVR